MAFYRICEAISGHIPRFFLAPSYYLIDFVEQLKRRLVVDLAFNLGCLAHRIMYGHLLGDPRRRHHFFRNKLLSVLDHLRWTFFAGFANVLGRVFLFFSSKQVIKIQYACIIHAHFDLRWVWKHWFDVAEAVNILLRGGDLSLVALELFRTFHALLRRIFI